MMIKYRVHELAKDFGVSTKEMVEILGKFFEQPKKSMTALEEDELAVVLDYMSQQNQVANFDAYFAVGEKARSSAENDKASEKKNLREQQKELADQMKADAKKETVGAAGDASSPVTAEKPVEDAKADAEKENTTAVTPPARVEADASASPNGTQAAAPAPSGTPAADAAPPKRAAQRPGKIQRVGPPPAGLNKKPDGEQKIGAKAVGQRPQSKPGEQPNRGPAEIRRVDTKTVTVNLEKYNEKYERIAPANTMQYNNNFQRKQKINQKSQNYRRPFGTKPRETEADKLRKLQLERIKNTPLRITVGEEISVADLAALMKKTAGEVIKKLMGMGVMATLTETIDFDTAYLVATELGCKVERAVVVTIEDKIIDDTIDTDENSKDRSPIVVVMGHVDHGKTSLLDAIRDAKVTAGEAGGITQHIGAYQVKQNGRDITFLDTPGHAAFTSMRQRGAMVTDIAILVVAADDGIMPQTIEAINHAKAAEVQIIVAINKIDKPDANPDRVMQQLTEHGLVPEVWGGEIICVPVSAKTQEGIDTLLENVLLVADMLELKANPERRARGSVIEARLDKGRGPVATLLIQTGTLHVGDILVAGQSVGRVRTMVNDHQIPVEEAGPSVPVEITGLAEVPDAGDIFDAVSDERLARELVEQRKTDAKEKVFNATTKVTLDNLFDQLSEGEIKDLNVIVKADVQGSVEAIKQNLEKLSNEEVRVRVIHGGVGAVSESDVMLAGTSGAIVVGFNVRPEPLARDAAERDGVDIRLYRVIYDCIEEIESAMKGMLAPKYRDVDQGRVEVRDTYKISNVGTIAGCYVTEGKITRNSKIRVVRDGIIIADDELASLRRFKDDVKEVATGYECGIRLEKFNDVKLGDFMEAYIIEEYRDN